MKKTLIVLTLAALLGTVPASAQVDFTRYVALGDSLTAGYVSGGLVQYYQDRSYPAYLAQQAGAPVFEMPTVSEPGLAPLLELLALVPAPSIQPKPGAPGLPTNAEYPLPLQQSGRSRFQDPGYCSKPPATSTTCWRATPTTSCTILVLRFPALPDGSPFPALTQAIAQNPTFVTLWIGNNDILGAAVAATPIDGITMTPVDLFEQQYQQALGGAGHNDDRRHCCAQPSGLLVNPLRHDSVELHHDSGDGHLPTDGRKRPDRG